MQIIQSPLGNNIHPLGVISSLSNPERMILRKQSHSLHSGSNFISPIQTKLPLVTSSKFLLSRENEPSIQPLIGWDSWDNQDINSDLPLFESDSFDSIPLPENSHINTDEILKNSIPDILPNRIDKKTSDDTSQQLNIKGKSKSKKANKSQKLLEKKSNSKSRKAAKPSVAKKSVQKNVNINSNENSLLTSDEPLSIETNLEIPTLQLDNAVVDNSLGLPSALTSPELDDAPTLLHPLVNDENTVVEHIAVPNSESSVAKNPIAIQQEIDSNVSSDFLANIPVQLTPTLDDIEDTPNLFRNSDNHEPLVISESQSAMVVNVSDALINLTSLQRDSYLESTNNEFTESQPILVPPEIVEIPTITPTSPKIGETAIAPLTATSPEISEIPIINAISPEIGETAIAPLTATSPEIVETPTISAISPKIGETAIAPLSVTSPEISEIPTITPTSPKIGETAIAPLSATSPEISEIPTITPTSPKISETAIAPLSATSPEISEIPTIIPTSPKIGETAIAPLSATSPEIVETPIISAISPEISEIPTISAISPEIGETAIAPLSATSPEISEIPIINAISPEIGETAIAPLSATSPEISEIPIITPTSPEIGETAIAPLSAISPEISEIPIITATSPEIGETAIAPLTVTSPEISETPIISAISPKIGETAIAPLTVTSPEISGTPIITPTSPKIGETAIAPLSAISPEISEIPIITPTSPEIGETAIAPLSATSPEISEIPIITPTSPEIVETASIFRKIIDNEQIVESEFTSAVTNEENPEILTFVDTSDNPTSPQNEVNTVPQVEQNAIAENLPAPKGYATGGHVTDSRVENRQQIAASDTVPAMLTPGEFVINTRDAQKNLPLLHHINTGGTPQDIILPSLQTPNSTEPEETISSETPTKVDSFPDTSLQLKSAETDSPEISNSLIPSSLGLNINKQRLSILNSPEIHTLHNETIDVGESSPQYSSPPLIFRKANSPTKTSSQWSNTPSQWSSVEDLLNGNDDEFTSFNFHDGEFNSQNYEYSHVSESPQVFAKHLPSPRGFADGEEVTPPDISREIAPVTETIESASSFSQGDDKDDTADLEALAREVYSRLRQRIEIERERHGGSSGRLPW
ncbi:MAG: hypothetical protein RM368_10835 [Nostoc sp. DedSLP03]|uniref:hypothetical protein n=1 Tax=Nostoc sp. DedSLP03 TaxID=3075400 RepID=UPI002AD4C27C|nr:hypothetical protein [Nostoc sp. DedSLP03]MDZ7965458.1 hypothetical protein [Nostoc sp. DedSLP03]